MRKRIYLDIYPVLKAINGIKWVDWDRGQFQNVDDPENFPLPAILVSIGDSHWSDRIAGIQEGVIDVNVDLYMHSYGDTTFEGGRNHDTLDALGFLDEIYKAVQFLQNDDVQSFTRVSESVMGNTPFVLGYRVVFKSRVIDRGLERSLSTRKATANITTSVLK